MSKTHEATVELLIQTVKEALEDGRASENEIKQWLVTAILLEELSLEDAAEEEAFAPYGAPSPTVH